MTHSTLFQEETTEKPLLQHIRLLEERLQQRDVAILESEEELTALKSQMIHLRDLYNRNREQNEQQKRVNQQLSQALKEKSLKPSVAPEDTEKLKIENAALHSSLTEIQQHSKQLERVIQFLRERAEESHLEAKQLREEFQINRELVNTLTTQTEAHDQELKMAQQHLGKKMREAALLYEKNEEFAQQIQNLEAELTESRHQTNLAQQALNSLQLREQSLEEQLSTKDEEVESIEKAWEDRYSQIYDKWQESEHTIKQFKALEDKHFQAQNAIANLFSLFGQPQMPTSLASAKLSTKQLFDDQRHSITLVEAIHAAPQVKQEKINIFDNGISQVRYKQTLFD